MNSNLTSPFALVKYSGWNNMALPILMLLNTLLLIGWDLSFITVLNILIYGVLCWGQRSVSVHYTLSVFLVLVYISSVIFKWNIGTVYGASDEYTTYLNYYLNTFYKKGAIYDAQNFVIIESSLHKLLVQINLDFPLYLQKLPGLELKKLSSIFGVLTIVKAEKLLKYILKNPTWLQKKIVFFSPFIIFYSIIGVRDIIIAYLVITSFIYFLDIVVSRKKYAIVGLFFTTIITMFFRLENAALNIMLFGIMLVFFSKNKSIKFSALILAIVSGILLWPQISYFLYLYEVYNTKILEFAGGVSLLQRLKMLPIPLNILFPFLYSLLCAFPISHGVKLHFIQAGTVDGLLDVDPVLSFSLVLVIKALGYLYYHILIIYFLITVIKDKPKLNVVEKYIVFYFLIYVFALSIFGVDSGHFLLVIPLVTPLFAKYFKKDMKFLYSLFFYIMLHVPYFLLKIV